jgi:hypothetical protein
LQNNTTKEKEKKNKLSLIIFNPYAPLPKVNENNLVLGKNHVHKN